MAITGFSAVLYYGIFASVTGGYVPYRVKNWWLVVFHLYLFLSFIILPLIIALVSSHISIHTNLQPPSEAQIHIKCSLSLTMMWNHNILTCTTSIHNEHTLFLFLPLLTAWKLTPSHSMLINREFNPFHPC